eukprot:TRINITY_DN786_c0_g1_i3.p1 TRINITY_DN786_c0_g1~~TRINITY_DN786_c0_g1_i3.p1  ORF type:complete len:845 (+),score=153.14 TRINITY_DN786_c0_g1_i3:1086-3620(+)
MNNTIMNTQSNISQVNAADLLAASLPDHQGVGNSSWHPFCASVAVHYDAGAGSIANSSNSQGVSAGSLIINGANPFFEAQTISHFPTLMAPDVNPVEAGNSSANTVRDHENFELHLCTECSSGSCEQHGYFRRNASNNSEMTFPSCSGAGSSTLNGNCTHRYATESVLGPMKRTHSNSENAVGLVDGSQNILPNQERNCDLNVCSHCNAGSCSLHDIDSDTGTLESIDEQMMFTGTNINSSLQNVNGNLQHPTECRMIQTKKMRTSGPSMPVCGGRMTNNEDYHSGIDQLHLYPSSSNGTATSNGSHTPVTNGSSFFVDSPTCSFSAPLVSSNAISGNTGIAGSTSRIGNSQGSVPVDDKSRPNKRKIDELSHSSSSEAPQAMRLHSHGPSLSLSTPEGPNSSSMSSTFLSGISNSARTVASRAVISSGNASQDPTDGLTLSGVAASSHRNERLWLSSTPQRTPNMLTARSSGNIARPRGNPISQTVNPRRSIRNHISPGMSLNNQLPAVNYGYPPLPWSYSDATQIAEPFNLFSQGTTAISNSPMQEEGSNRGLLGANNSLDVIGAEAMVANSNNGNWVHNRSSSASGSNIPLLVPVSSIQWELPPGSLTQLSRRSGGQRSGTSSVSRTRQGSHSVPSGSGTDTTPIQGTDRQAERVRSALLVDQQIENLIPFSTPVSDGEGRRMLNEMRTMIEAYRNRRGQASRLEDRYAFEAASFRAVAEMHDQHRDMRLDVDNMSYEELLALGERIGNVSTGLTEDTIAKLLRKFSYAGDSGNKPRKNPEDELCSICREEYMENDELGILDCGHLHHSECIKQWLLVKNICPICRAEALKVPEESQSKRS